MKEVMNRFSFIQENYSTKIKNECGEENCECDDLVSSNQFQLIRKTKLIHLIIMTTLAFLLAFALAEYKNQLAKSNVDDWIQQKNETAIGCNSDEQRSSNSQPEDRSKKNGCAHSFANIPGITGNKKGKIHSC